MRQTRILLLLQTVVSTPLLASYMNQHGVSKSLILPTKFAVEVKPPLVSAILNNRLSPSRRGSWHVEMSPTGESPR